MELHLLNLYKLCRICGGIVVTKRGYVNAKTCSDCVDLLITCFGILPSEDKEVRKNLNPFKYSWCPSKTMGDFLVVKNFFERIWKVSFVLRWGERIYGGTYKNRLQRGEDLT